MADSLGAADEYARDIELVKHYATLQFAELSVAIAVTGAAIGFIFRAESPTGPTREFFMFGMAFVTFCMWVIQESNSSQMWLFLKRAAALELTLGYQGYVKLPSKLGWASAPGTWAFRFVYLLMIVLWLAAGSGRLPEPTFNPQRGFTASQERLGAKSVVPTPQLGTAHSSTFVGDWVKEATAATAVATAFIAALVAITTWGQWATNRDRLRHELFDRRYEIYQKIAAFVADVLQSGRVDHGADIAFLRQTKLAHFAFAGDPAIRKLVDDIYRRATLLQTLQAKQAGLSGAALEANVDRETEVKQWFQTTLSSLDSTFEKYLRLRH